MVSKAAWKVQKPRLEFLFNFFISLSGLIDLGENDWAEKSGVRRRHGEQGCLEGPTTKCGISFYAFFSLFGYIDLGEKDSAEKSGVRRRHGEQGWSEGPKTKCGISIFTFLFRFLS